MFDKLSEHVFDSPALFEIYELPPGMVISVDADMDGEITSVECSHGEFTLSDWMHTAIWEQLGERETMELLIIPHDGRHLSSPDDLSEEDLLMPLAAHVRDDTGLAPDYTSSFHRVLALKDRMEQQHDNIVTCVRLVGPALYTTHSESLEAFSQICHHLLDAAPAYDIGGEVLNRSRLLVRMEPQCVGEYVSYYIADKEDLATLRKKASSSLAKELVGKS